MAVGVSNRPSKIVIAALKEFCQDVNIRYFREDLRKMVFAYLQSDEHALLYDYSSQLFGDLDALFSLLVLFEDFQIATKSNGGEHA